MWPPYSCSSKSRTDTDMKIEKMVPQMRCFCEEQHKTEVKSFHLAMAEIKCITNVMFICSRLFSTEIFMIETKTFARDENGNETQTHKCMLENEIWRR